MIRRLACERYKNANGIVKKEGSDLAACPHANRLSSGHKGRGHVRVMTGRINKKRLCHCDHALVPLTVRCPAPDLLSASSHGGRWRLVPSCHRHPVYSGKEKSQRLSNPH